MTLEDEIKVEREERRKVVAFLRKVGKQVPSDGLRQRQRISDRSIRYGQAVLLAAADHIEDGKHA